MMQMVFMHKSLKKTKTLHSLSNGFGVSSPFT
jgi:hypothetical protein